MERFNSKLYEKYTNLKKRKFSSIEESNQKIISDVLQYQSAMELLIGDLKNENDKLRAEIISTEDRYQECQKLLLEENHKLKMLSNEAGALKELLQKGDNADRSLQNSACKNPATRLEDVAECLLGMKSLDTLPGKNASPSEKNASFTLHEDYNQNQLIPDCCKKTKAYSEDGIERSYRCAFHILVELLVGMKFVVDIQAERPCFSVIHQMSGYNFTLSWVGDSNGEEGKMAYHVSSLGTIESIALDWMKEDIVFSTAMFPVFFDRLSRVVGNK